MGISRRNWWVVGGTVALVAAAALVWSRCDCDHEHRTSGCYVRKSLVVTDAAAVIDPDVSAGLGLTKVGPEALIEGHTDRSASKIDERIDIYTTSYDSLTTAIVLRAHRVPSAAPIAMAAYAGHWTFLPGRSPARRTSRPLSIDVGSGGDGPLIAIADTGLLEDLPPGWDGLLKGTDITEDNVVTQQSDWEKPKEYGEHIRGHGTFVAGVVRQALPSARLLVAKVHRVAENKFVAPTGDPLPDSETGVTDELHVFDAITRLTKTAGEDEIAGLNLSLGALACPELVSDRQLAEYLAENAESFAEIEIRNVADGEVQAVDVDDIDRAAVIGASRAATKSLDEAIELWETEVGLDNAPIFASAGNEGVDFRFAPATFVDVAAVGSMDFGGDSSCFSAVGDTSEVGENIVGISLDDDGSPRLVTWSGTSFSSPAALARRLGGDPSNIVVDPGVEKNECDW